MKIAAFSTFLFICFIAKAQSPVETQLNMKIDKGVNLMEAGKYEEADEHFRYVLNNMTKLPSDLAYYFGKNSYHLGKYKQSINWLNKYLQLKGTKGRFHEESSKYLDLAEEAYITQHKEKTKEYENDLKSGEYDCDGLSKMICPVCKGEGVIVKNGPFEKIYQTCPYSNGESYLTCEEYNLFMKGELKPKTK